MRRSELEHAIRAACDVAGVDEIIVIGSQAVLGQFPDAPGALRQSREVDVFSTTSPTAPELIDGVLGELSQFDQTHGFYVHGVGPETAILPAGWEERLIAVQNENTRGCTGWCLEVHDLAASKLVAGREKDIDFVTALLSYGMARRDVLAARIDVLPLGIERREQLRRAAAGLDPKK
jgi:hypothetical protein